MGHAQLLVCLSPWCLPLSVGASSQLAVWTEIPTFSFEMQATSPYLPARRNNHVIHTKQSFHFPAYYELLFLVHVVELIHQAMSSTFHMVSSVTKQVGIYFPAITLFNFLKDIYLFRCFVV